MLVTRPGQRALSVRFHRFERGAADSRRRRHAGAGHRRALPHPGRAAGPRRRGRHRTGLRAASGRPGRGRRRAHGWASRATSSPSTASTRWRRRPATPSWSAPRAPSRRCARSRTPARSRCCGWPARPPTPRWPIWSQRGGLRPGRTEKEVGRDLESLMLDHGADGVSFETIVAAGAELGDPAPPADRRRAGGGRLRQDRLRRAGGRLPLRHDPHLRAGARRAVAARHLRPGRHRAAGRPGGAGARAWRCATWTPHRGR